MIGMRKCFSCGDPISFSGFIFAAVKNNTEYKMGIDTAFLCEIWNNDIFVLNCCKCHRFKKIFAEHLKGMGKRPYRCKKCGHPIELERDFCYTCGFD